MYSVNFIRRKYTFDVNARAFMEASESKCYTGRISKFNTAASLKYKLLHLKKEVNHTNVQQTIAKTLQMRRK